MVNQQSPVAISKTPSLVRKVMESIGRGKYFADDINMVNSLVESSKNKLWMEVLKLEKRQHQLREEIGDLQKAKNKIGDIREANVAQDKINALERQLNDQDYQITFIDKLKAAQPTLDDVWDREVQNRFLTEFSKAQELQRNVPDEANYQYTRKGAKVVPFLMQARTACMTTERLPCYEPKCEACEYNKQADSVTNNSHRRECPNKKHRPGVGNWCRPGTGKTLAAILASRQMNAKTTLIICPSSVVDYWGGCNKKNDRRQVVFVPGVIESVYKNVDVRVIKNTKDLGKAKNWKQKWSETIPKHRRYIVASIGMLQQKAKEDGDDQVDSLRAIESLVRGCAKGGFPIELVVFDEIQQIKEAENDDGTTNVNRVETATTLVRECRKSAKNKKFPHRMFVLGLSGTPVINKLREAQSLMNIIADRKVKLDESVFKNDFKPENCAAVHRELMKCGLRIAPENNVKPENLKFELVDGTTILTELKNKFPKFSNMQLEIALTEARLPKLIEIVKKNKEQGLKTLLYTQYIDVRGKRIRKILESGMEDTNIKLNFYTGAETAEKKREHLDHFVNGNLDLLIATSAIATGTDGLQENCYNLLVNGLPFTAAAWDQLIGRLQRSGQKKDVKVTIVRVGSESLYPKHAKCDFHTCKKKHSRDEGDWYRIVLKRTVGDAAVDGIIPLHEGNLKKYARETLNKQLKDILEEKQASIKMFRGEAKRKLPEILQRLDDGDIRRRPDSEGGEEMEIDDEATDDDEDESMGHGEDEEEGPPNKKRRISGRMEFKINQEEWWNRYLDTITKAQKIVRGRYPNTSSYKQGLKLAQEHCSKFSGLWNKLEEIRKMAKPNSEGGTRDEQIANLGKDWWDKQMGTLNRTHPTIFGSLYHEDIEQLMQTEWQLNNQRTMGEDELEERRTCLANRYETALKNLSDPQFRQQVNKKDEGSYSSTVLLEQAIEQVDIEKKNRAGREETKSNDDG